jgi:hypothetical protein
MLFRKTSTHSKGRKLLLASAAEQDGMRLNADTRLGG